MINAEWARKVTAFSDEMALKNLIMDIEINILNRAKMGNRELEYELSDFNFFASVYKILIEEGFRVTYNGYNRILIEW